MRSLNSYQKDKIKIHFQCKCAVCGIQREKKFFDIHHLNKNTRHNNYDNLIIVCNLYTDTNCHKKLHDGGENENKRKKDQTKDIRINVNYNDGTVPMQVNDLAEMPYRNWLYAVLKKRGKYLWKECINSGAEVCGISVTTTRKYLNKLTSEFGKLEAYKDIDSGKKYVRFKK